MAEVGGGGRGRGGIVQVAAGNVVEGAAEDEGNVLGEVEGGGYCHH